MIRQAGAQDVDLLLLPSNDWYAIRDIHPAMATFRAVENGMQIFRQTGNGKSTIIDGRGNVINSIDMYEQGDPDTWGGVQMMELPLRSGGTLYARTGDVFGLVMVLGFFGLLAVALLGSKSENR